MPRPLYETPNGEDLTFLLPDAPGGHQSCDLCRSHLHEHLVDLDIPGDSRRAEDWARFFWRAHNFVNEQTQVTRCGSQECGWGSWTTPAAAHEPVGVYRNPWFMTYANAEKRWKHADE